jgi:hypothetical protein
MKRSATSPARYAKPAVLVQYAYKFWHPTTSSLFIKLFGRYYFKFFRPNNVLIPSEHCSKTNDSCLPLYPTHLTPIIRALQTRNLSTFSEHPWLFTIVCIQQTREWFRFVLHMYRNISQHISHSAATLLHTSRYKWSLLQLSPNFMQIDYKSGWRFQKGSWKILDPITGWH